jgi:hypothetical protein
VAIALGSRPAADCPAFDQDGSNGVDISELVSGVRNALSVCGAAAPS